MLSPFWCTVKLWIMCMVPWYLSLHFVMLAIFVLNELMHRQFRNQSSIMILRDRFTEKNYSHPSWNSQPYRIKMVRIRNHFVSFYCNRGDLSSSNTRLEIGFLGLPKLTFPVVRKLWIETKNLCQISIPFFPCIRTRTHFHDFERLIAEKKTGWEEMGMAYVVEMGKERSSGSPKKRKKTTRLFEKGSRWPSSERKKTDWRTGKMRKKRFLCWGYGGLGLNIVTYGHNGNFTSPLAVRSILW